MSDNHDNGGQNVDTELPYLWQKLDASVLALERLSAAVNKPDELERLIGESKKLLKHTIESPDAASGGRFSASAVLEVVDNAHHLIE